MPRRGDNIQRTKRGRWTARKKVKLVVDGPQGPETLWKDVQRTFDAYDDAKEWTREVERAEKSGEGWTDRRTQAVATLRRLALDYAASAEQAGAPEKTVQFRDTMMGSWLDFLGGREDDDPPATRPVTELSRDLLAAYAASLPGEGPAATTRYRKVLEVEHMWTWAWKHHPERYPGLPPARRYTAGPNDADGLRKPPPVVAMAAPRWADVDAMIRCLKEPWHRRVGILARSTALRASQLCNLTWRDVDLARGRQDGGQHPRTLVRYHPCRGDLDALLARARWLPHRRRSLRGEKGRIDRPRRRRDSPSRRLRRRRPDHPSRRHRAV